MVRKQIGKDHIYWISGGVLLWVLCTFIVLPVAGHAQTRTVGVMAYTHGSFDGYTLLAPARSDSVFLIDNCGREVHSWADENEPGIVTYLLENGNLLRTASFGNSSNPLFNFGGSGDAIRIYDWNNNKIWEWMYSDSSHRMHHDVEVMPNGNILVLAWELRNHQECLDAGRQANTLPAEGIRPESIVEIRPIFPDSAEIVWEWHLWDHLIQEHDSLKDNFGTVNDHPELLNINWLGDDVFGNPDWIHCNSVDYNEDLDQIMLSTRALCEIWIIDHSTSSTEAAGHSGGQHGKGGDFLYRWGFPASYGANSGPNRALYFQHDAHWIPDSLTDGGKIMVFNNGTSRPAGTYSSVDIIAPPVDSNGVYAYANGQSYGPDSAEWSYTTPVPEDFYAQFISNAQRLPNGNTLINQGTWGHLFEITAQNDKVWEYVSPIDDSGRITQGNQPNPGPNISANNRLFRAYRYPPDFAAFQGKDLTPAKRLEIDPNPPLCNVFTERSENRDLSFSVFPNPATHLLTLEMSQSRVQKVQVFDLLGKPVYKGMLRGKRLVIDVSDWQEGVFVLRLGTTVRKILVRK